VAQVAADGLVYETTASAVQEKRKLRRHFRRFDIFFYLICTVVTLDTVDRAHDRRLPDHRSQFEPVL
jgi:hypothetical protein